ncbi:Z1 domain-containing protein [Candidatus Methanoperedens nitratireducens]|uniref:Putative endonuclease, Z1 domain protein n=1 Tax=Candidatus Methanoperedens nitratireducens TaxID=1392998 RepID=A0A284VMF3_9EURY|nr:Z1 domain-containing protein [Candidatus Methanoperedens nitroreducens]SNQ60393.1 putative endonuclease, Z1 domain protein [Candidatus Methanoperedens nitroreducens]
MIDYDKARQLVMVMLKGEQKISREVIREKVQIVQNMVSSENPTGSIDWEMLIKDIESRCNVWIGTGTVLDYREDHKPWLPDRRSQIQWKFWKRYERYLEEEKGWSDKTVIRLGEFTDQILERLENPQRLGKWDRRGMVVGQVQSGKTANYTGLICKAVDAGYKLIIVLAGQHKSLRSQTQLRLDAEFLGFDTQLNRAFNQENLRIGVGRLTGEEFLTVHSLTSNADNGDFNKKVAIQVGVIPGGGDPVLLVVKKNKSVLSNLLNWAVSVRGEKDIENGKKIVKGIPLLVIDDEADNASINTNPIPLDENGKMLEDYDVTAINGMIRQLLDSFEKTAYVGYTATPFANIFIFPQGETDRHGKDLFPESFIINLPAPSNYIGPAKVFGIYEDDAGVESEKGLPIIRPVDDFKTFIPDNHRKDYIPPGLPNSLRRAIRAFILSCATRMVRGQEKNHNSMLVHVTRYTDVQKKLADLISEELTFLRRRLEYGDGNTSEPLIAELEDLWREDYLETTRRVKEQISDPLIKDIDWNDVKQSLYRAADKIQLKIINGTARDVLDYRDHPNGLSVIVIGGDKLSRGLTLEGLTVSYYLRASRMYDTLMQMGRWFGYRPGYIDLCRLYTSEELVTWYRHITLASEELRNDFDYMAALGGTPKDYGLRVRTHPEGLFITAVNKMRTGTEMELSYDGHLIETVVFHTDRTTVESNYNVVDGFIRERGSCSGNNGRKIWRDIPSTVITQLLRGIIVHPESRKANPEILRQYIEAQMENNELNRWTVALISNTKPKAKTDRIGGHNVGLVLRTNADEKCEKYSMTKGHLISPTDEMIDLSEEQIIRAKEKMKEKTGKSPEIPSGGYIRGVRSPENGLLLIYPLDPEPAGTSKPVMGFAFSFPESSSARKIKYRVNNVYWEQEFGGHD